MSPERTPSTKLTLDRKANLVRECLIYELRRNRTLQDHELTELFTELQDLSDAELCARAHSAEVSNRDLTPKDTPNTKRDRLQLESTDYERIALTLRTSSIGQTSHFNDNIES
jgi:hypothetical protein